MTSRSRRDGEQTTTDQKRTTRKNADVLICVCVFVWAFLNRCARVCVHLNVSRHVCVHVRERERERRKEMRKVENKPIFIPSSGDRKSVV